MTTRLTGYTPALAAIIALAHAKQEERCPSWNDHTFEPWASGRPFKTCTKCGAIERHEEPVPDMEPLL